MFQKTPFLNYLKTIRSFIHPPHETRCPRAEPEHLTSCPNSSGPKAPSFPSSDGEGWWTGIVFQPPRTNEHWTKNRRMWVVYRGLNVKHVGFKFQCSKSPWTIGILYLFFFNPTRKLAGPFPGFFHRCSSQLRCPDEGLPSFIQLVSKGPVRNLTWSRLFGNTE